MSKNRETHHFILVLSDIEEPTPEIEDALYNAGCDDALIVFRNRVLFLVFDRETTCFEIAIFSAIENVTSSGIEAGISHIEPGDIVTMPDIAKRLGRTRESIRQLARGERGGGGFPTPISGVDETSQTWSWAEVTKWLILNEKISDRTIVERAEFIRRLNISIDQLNRSLHPVTTSEFTKKLQKLMDEVESGSTVQAYAGSLVVELCNRFPIQNNGIVLNAEFDYFLEHQDELNKVYQNQFLVIKNKQVIGSYDTFNKALQYAKENYTIGNFLIQECLPGIEAYRRACVSKVFKRWSMVEDDSCRK